MTGLTYSSGEPIRVGDTVRRSRTAQSLYEVTDIRATGRPSVGLVPRYGYTRASTPIADAVAALVLVEEARPTTDLGLDLPLTRVVDAWDEGYRAGVHDATHPASSPTINPFQRSDVDADHVIAEAARAWWRADQRVTAEIEALDSVKAAHQRLTEALASEAAWLSRQPGQGAGS